MRKWRYPKIQLLTKSYGQPKKKVFSLPMIAIYIFLVLILMRNILTFFFRDYCNDLKISDNNTEFLLNFNEFIDRKTPNNPSCKYMLIYNNWFTVIIFKVIKPCLVQWSSLVPWFIYLLFEFLMESITVWPHFTILNK